MISQLFIAYLTLNAVLAAGFLSLLISAPLLNRASHPVRLRLHYAALVFCILVTAGVLAVPSRPVLQPVVRVWTAVGKPPASEANHPSFSKGVIGSNSANIPLGADNVFLFVVGLGFGALAAGTLHILHGQRRLRRLVRESFVLRSLGKVRLLVSAQIKVPLSFRTYNRAYVVIPHHLTMNAGHFRLAVAHELQHHRQGDTLWAYMLVLARAACVLNPLFHLWFKWINDIQEFACDEALVGRHRGIAGHYARCLIEVAENAWEQRELPVCATGMVFLRRGHLLNRRINNMFAMKKNHGRLVWAVPALLTASLLTGTAFAAKGLVQDRRINLAQAQELARKAQPGAQFPIVMNQEVLAWLNRFAGTPEGREQMRAALKRMDSYRYLLSKKLSEYQVPAELAAIPIIESGYKNLRDSNTPGWGAGIWMFIASTARNYGLTVNQNIDERLDEIQETDAAMRLLLANKLRFQDWPLSVMAYNIGENALEQAIRETGSRDAWEIVRRAQLSGEGKNYLPKLTAAILIMKNPSLLD